MISFLSELTSPEHVIYIENKDSFEAVRKGQQPLVMNFASARHPGGGFLSGARAQEEALCRASTLYKSLSSSAAAEMYEYNNTHKNPFYSDYMILTPEVCVFRNRYGKLLIKPFMVSVWTIPAPNKNGPARSESQSSIDSVMEKRLEYFLAATAERGYDRLILGAWGCGAFGHDALDVAGYFRHLLIDKGYMKLFRTVNFAILDTPEQYKVKAFINVFGGKIIKYKE